MTEYPRLKEFIDRPLIEQIAARIAAAHPPFPKAEFVAAVVAELDALELKARHGLIARQLREFLPADYPAALEILLAILDETRGFEPIENAGLRLMSLPAFVEWYGLKHPRASLDAMPIITRVSSCEFALRPYLIQHRAVTMARLRIWVDDADEHLRRLVSEGSRPRLPWGSQLTDFIADPTPMLALLERLKDDTSLYVRRSVANHLNDISKDHPELLLARMETWSEAASEERQWLINHALRSLVKRGDQRALSILGYGPAQVELTGLTVEPEILHFGGKLSFSFELRSTGDCSQRLMIDYVMRFMKANGKTAPKVFKLRKMTINAGQRLRLEKSHAIRPITTRRYYPGKQRLEIQVNGRILGGADFALVMGDGAR